jgi:molybdopterin synthase catalytic subunit
VLLEGCWFAGAVVVFVVVVAVRDDGDHLRELMSCKTHKEREEKKMKESRWSWPNEWQSLRLLIQIFKTFERG